MEIFIRPGKNPFWDDKTNKYLRGPQSSPKQCLITLKFISSAPWLFLAFRVKKAFFNWLIDKDWLGKTVFTVFKKLSNGIDGSGTFFAKDRPISAKFC